MYSRKYFTLLFGFVLVGRQNKIFKDRLCPELFIYLFCYPSIKRRSCCSRSKNPTFIIISFTTKLNSNTQNPPGDLFYLVPRPRLLPFQAHIWYIWSSSAPFRWLFSHCTSLMFTFPSYLVILHRHVVGTSCCSSVTTNISISASVKACLHLLVLIPLMLTFLFLHEYLYVQYATSVVNIHYTSVFHSIHIYQRSPELTSRLRYILNNMYECD